MLPIRTQAQCTDYLEHQRSTDHHLKQHLILLSHRGLTASVVVDLTVLLVWECQMKRDTAVVFNTWLSKAAFYLKLLCRITDCRLLPLFPIPDPPSLT